MCVCVLEYSVLTLRVVARDCRYITGISEPLVVSGCVAYRVPISKARYYTAR